MARYRNPNGYGSVVKLSGNRRRPYAVRRTVGFDDRAYPIYETIGYYQTRKEAVIALAMYNSSPYDIKLSRSTFSQLYEMWSRAYFPKMGSSLVGAHKAAYSHCSRLYGLLYTDIRKIDMQRCIDECGRSYATQTNIRNLFVQLDKFAYDNDIISKCYSANLTVSEANATREHRLFTDDEVKALHQHIGEPCVDETLFLLYTGCRVTEMLTLRQSNIDYERRILQFGIKTEAGKNRIVPIHEKLLPILQTHTTDPVFSNPEWSSLKPKSQYSKFIRMWATVCPDHFTHDCRHTVRSKLDSADANKVCINLIIGHKTQDVGERVYTHKTIEELRTAMSKLSYDI